MRYFKIYCFLFIYLFSCISLVIDFHYCGGDLAFVSLYQADEDGCCGDDEEKIPGCCNDKLIVIDTDDSEAGKKYIVKGIDEVKCVAVYVPFTTVLVNNEFVLKKMVIPINHAPPDVLQSHLFIKNRVLLI